MATIYALTNQKGGVGKTTSVANLGAAFAERGKKTLLIDLDPQGGLTTSLGYNPDTFKQTVYHVFIEEIEFPQVTLETDIPNLDLVPANLDLAGAEAELLREIGWDKILPGALEPIQEKYDVILLDCPPTLGILTLSALAAANIALVPLQCEFLSLRALKQLTKIFTKTKRRANPGLDLLIFRTMYDKRTSHAKEISEEIGRVGGKKVLSAYVKRAIKVVDASSSGKPVVVYAPNSEPAGAYRSIAHELLLIEKKKEQTHG
ncbi:chromosome partitioning protein [candidate division KSB3 bacterium]|uniref:Chromosome partitioning protein n=1 Tax=candidate division KSB3 bacterium TaxID=2044937 RepID=A0A2G6KHE2_9BACT|nr:MAG: chromosome partitioning protein [candidate division KSB3 bacterium]